MSHTPGPWVWSAGRRAGSCLLIGSDGTQIISATAEDGSPQDDDLIAAAPDLLEALEAMHEAFKYTSHNPEEDEANRKASAAIAKARGNA